MRTWANSSGVETEQGGLQTTSQQGERGQISEAFAPAFRQNGAAPDAVGDVAAHQRADLLQAFLGHVRGVQPPQDPQDRRAVAAAAGHAGADGDLLADIDGQALRRQTSRLKKPRRRLGGDVAVAFGEVGEVCCYRESGACLRGDGQLVRQVDGLHHHPQLVVAVRTLAQDVQGEIQFCVGWFRMFHGRGSRSSDRPAR